MPSEEVLSTVAAMIAGFGAAIVSFRIQRELQMAEWGERTWIPWADWMLMIATALSLLLGLLPLVTGMFPSDGARRLSSAATSAVVLVAVYPFALLAHYRLLFAGKRAGPRSNPEPPELYMTLGALIAAIVVAAAVGNPMR